MRILVISMAGIGDTILATPLIHELRANFPEAQIDAAVRWGGSKDILEGNPHLNAIHQCNLLKASNAEILRFLCSLRRRRYDVSINTHPQSRMLYRAMARLFGARARISHVYDGWRLFDRLLVNRTLPQDYQRHTVEQNLDVLGLLGKQPRLPMHELEIFLGAAERQWARDFIATQGLGTRKLLGIHVGSGRTKNLVLKRWPLDHYIALVGRISQTWPELAVLLFGGPDEEPDLRGIIDANPSAPVFRTRSQTLRQAGALMQRCTAFLSVDTALMHVAAAVKAPHQLVIEAPTLNPTNVPYANPYTLIPNASIAGRHLEYYRYDGKGIRGTREELIRCMASVSVEAVLAAVGKAIARDEGRVPANA